MDIEELLKQNLPNKEIAKILNKSIKTVCRLRSKYNIKSPNLSSFKIYEHKDEILNYLSENKNDADISRILNCNPETIRQFRIKNDIPANFSYNDFRKHDYENIKELILSGLKDSEIANELNIPEISIYFIRKKENIIREAYNIAKPISISSFQKSVLIGTIFGDASLTLNENGLSARGKMEHCLAQRDYIHYKYDILKELCCERFYSHKRTNPFIGRDNGNHVEYTNSVSIFLKTNPELNWYYNLFYKPKKTITKELLEHYDYISLAFHIMDDGSKSGKSIILCNHAFSKEENEMFINHLKEKLNIECTLRFNGKVVYVKRKSFNVILENCKQYFCDSMLYKIT